MDLRERLKQRAALLGVRPAGRSEAVEGGREGEDLVRRLVGESLRFKNARLLGGRRIPSKAQGRRREIDLIVCTPRMVHLIEVKNWSGRLDLRGGHWLQTRRGGEVVDHGDLLAENRLKRDAVVEYLADRGVALDDRFVRERIVPRVFFTNPRLELDPAAASAPGVLTRKAIDRYLKPGGGGGDARGFFATVVDACLDAETGLLAGLAATLLDRGPLARHREVVARLEEAGTWDRLRLYGTEVVAGDLIGLTVGSVWHPRKELAGVAGGRPIRLRWTRGRAFSLFKALTGFGALGRLESGPLRRPLGTDDTALFHAVGDGQPVARRLAEIDQIDLG